MTEVTAPAFREAADRESQRAVLSRGNGWQASFHGTPLSVIQDANADLLLAAAEQREQWDAAQVRIGVLMQQRHEAEQQIATLTAERDEARTERDALTAQLHDLHRLLSRN